MAGPECTTDLWMTATFEKPKTWQLKLSLVLSEAMLFAFTQVVKKNKKNKGAQQDSLSATQGNWKSLLVEDGNNLAVFLTLRTGLFFFFTWKAHASFYTRQNPIQLSPPAVHKEATPCL